MSNRNRSMLLAALATLVAVPSVWAGESQVKLSGAEEVPPVTTSATGTGTIAVGADKKISGEVKTTGVEGIAAHIHKGGKGESGPPVITLTKGADGAWSVPANTVLTDEQYQLYQAGKLYINVHSAANKGGEIRGQIKP